MLLALMRIPPSTGRTDPLLQYGEPAVSPVHWRCAWFLGQDGVPLHQDAGTVASPLIPALYSVHSEVFIMQP